MYYTHDPNNSEGGELVYQYNYKYQWIVFKESNEKDTHKFTFSCYLYKLISVIFLRNCCGTVRLNDSRSLPDRIYAIYQYRSSDNQYFQNLSGYAQCETHSSKMKWLQTKYFQRNRNIFSIKEYLVKWCQKCKILNMNINVIQKIISLTAVLRIYYMFCCSIYMLHRYCYIQ